MSPHFRAVLVCVVLLLTPALYAFGLAHDWGWLAYAVPVGLLAAAAAYAELWKGRYPPTGLSGR